MDRTIKIVDTDYLMKRLQEIEERQREIEVRMLGELKPFSELDSLSQLDIENLGRILGFTQYPLEHFANWFNDSTENGQLSSERILARLAELAVSASSHLTPEEIKHFFCEPHKDLYGDRPIDIIGTEVGYRAVRKILAWMLVDKHS